jgi:Bacterial EndoU nuclease
MRQFTEMYGDHVLDTDCEMNGVDECDFEGACMLRAIAICKHQELTGKYPDYAGNNINITALLNQHGAEKYLAVATLYEIFQEEGWPQLPTVEDIEFYIEIFGKHLVPIGITFIPYIGDYADIYLSCGGGISWDCAWAILGTFVPFDEFVDIIRNQEKVRFAWKVTRAYDTFRKAWSLLKNCPKEIRTDGGILSKVQGAINRGAKSAADLAAQATSYLPSHRIEHILRGDNGGGLHHISAMIANPNYKVIDRYVPSGAPAGSGFYRARVKKPDGTIMTPDKSFFPDDWDETKVIDEIKHAYGNKSKRYPNNPNNNHYLGRTVDGHDVLMYLDPSGAIISAFPHIE